ncbi:MAG TPA: porin [Polyangiaceae bacterium]|jgi:phosphate-selective porin OprO/OprP|nr:porin [Polyangiaceae bacterium]
MKIVDSISGSLLILLGLTRAAAADDLGPQQNPLPPSTLAPPPSSSAPAAPADANPPSSSTTETAPPPATPPNGPLPLGARATPTASGGPGDPASSVAGPGGFAITSADKQSEIRFRALVQTDARVWFDETQRVYTDTFLIRRAQPSLEGRLPYGVTFLLYPDFGGGTTSLQDAFLGLTLGDAVKFRFGKYRPTFGLERLQPTSNLSFVEFGLPTLVTPNRDVGAMVYGDLFGRIFGYAAGVYNGTTDNGSTDLDADREKEFVGRAYFRPLEPIKDVAGRLFVGGATSFGRVYGTPANPFSNPSAPAYKTPGQNTDFSYVAAPSGVTANYANTVVANGPHNRYGAYFYYALGPFSMMGEYYVSNQEVGRAGYPNVVLSNSAEQLQATFVLFGAKASYDFVHVETPFNPSAGHFGALELAARAGHLHIDTSAFPNYASPTASVRGATEGTVGINWYWSDNAKFVVNWDHTEFQGGAMANGPEALAGHREAENLFLGRAQVVY